MSNPMTHDELETDVNRQLYEWYSGTHLMAAQAGIKEYQKHLAEAIQQIPDNEFSKPRVVKLLKGE